MAKQNEIAKADKTTIRPVEQIENLILTIRGKQVILDRDLARLYGVETFRLNEQVKRNIERFPDDFMFQLTKEEFENWKSQIVTSIPNMSSQNARTSNADMLSQIAMTSAKRRPASALPYAFTENGIAMLSSVLRSPMAIATNIHIMRAFNALRHFIGSHAQVFQRIEVLERTQLSLVAFKEETNRNFEEVFRRLDDNSEKPEKGPKIAQANSTSSHKNSTSSKKEFLLAYCAIPRTLGEMMHYMNMRSRHSFISTYINPLLEEGLLQYTIPDQPTHPKQQYVTKQK